MESLCPPEMFALVEDNVFRSNDIRPTNVPFMKSLGLRTIVYLSPEAPSRTLLSFADASSAELVHLGAKPWHTPGWKPISDELVKEAIEMALDSTRHPIVFMCSSGVHVTGVIVGCLRRLQQWCLTSIIEEHRNTAGHTKTRFWTEQHIELFDTDLITLPESLPPWFEHQQRALEAEKEQAVALVTSPRGSEPAVKLAPVLKYLFSPQPPLVCEGTVIGKHSLCEDDDD